MWIHSFEIICDFYCRTQKVIKELKWQTKKDIYQECNPLYKYQKSLASTIIEMAHFQNFFMNNLPSLTDFGNNKDEAEIVRFLEGLVFTSLHSAH